MNKLKKLVHPGDEHILEFKEKSSPFSLTCNKCTKLVSKDYYKCIRYNRCGYCIHKDCAKLKDLPQKQHPLHPQHTLTIHRDFPCVKSFVCSFCKETRQSRRFYQCSEEHCDFYLDETCESEFSKRPELLDKYKIQHVFHDHENHHLYPYTPFPDIDYEIGDGNSTSKYDGCGFFVPKTFQGFKCTLCPFYLHTKCSQVPKEVVQHPAHPHHPLVLLQNQNPPAPDQQHLCCNACLKWIKNEFYLHCPQCPTFNLDLECYFQFERPTVRHEAHEHPLVNIRQIHNDEVSCYACNSCCDYDFFRCFACNFNIHSACLALPVTVDYDDHIHPLTLTTSFKEDSISNTYYCDICETRRNPDHGIYLCEECPFIAHFECALSLREEEYRRKVWSQKLEEDSDTFDENEEDMILTNEEETLQIYDQLHAEIEKLGEVIDQLITKKRDGEQLTEKFQEFEEVNTNAKDMLRQLEQSVRGN